MAAMSTQATWPTGASSPATAAGAAATPELVAPNPIVAASSPPQTNVPISATGTGPGSALAPLGSASASPSSPPLERKVLFPVAMLYALVQAAVTLERITLSGSSGNGSFHHRQLTSVAALAKLTDISSFTNAIASIQRADAAFREQEDAKDRATEWLKRNASELIKHHKEAVTEVQNLLGGTVSPVPSPLQGLETLLRWERAETKPRSEKGKKTARKTVKREAGKAPVKAGEETSEERWPE